MLLLYYYCYFFYLVVCCCFFLLLYGRRFYFSIQFNWSRYRCFWFVGHKMTFIYNASEWAAMRHTRMRPIWFCCCCSCCSVSLDFISEVKFQIKLYIEKTLLNWDLKSDRRKNWSIRLNFVLVSSNDKRSHGWEITCPKVYMCEFIVYIWILRVHTVEMLMHTDAGVVLTVWYCSRNKNGTIKKKMSKISKMQYQMRVNADI